MEKQRNTDQQMEARNAIELLTSDHKMVQQLFKQFEEIKEDPKMDDKRSGLVERICRELTIHARIEEEIFYPAMREAIDDMALMDESDVEHETAKYLISQLESMQAGDDHFNAKVCVLAEIVNHHIREEQNEMFAQAKKADIDLDELGMSLMRRKQELMQDMESPPPRRSSKSSSRRAEPSRKSSSGERRHGAH